MKTKFISLFALVLCMGAFIFPVNAYAMSDTESPTVKAWITDDILHIEATDTGTGVEAVYINDIRFNYRVDGALEVDAKDYAGDGETITIYAVDFAGNKSNTVKIDNPYYVAPMTTSENQAFTPDGTGTVVDDIVEQNSKEFFTIVTDAGNVFYLIVDRSKDSENVYLLNAVTEDDLMELAETSSGKSESAIPATSTTPSPEPTETENPASAEPTEADNGNSGTMIFIVLAMLAAGGAGYYFKIVRPKQQAADSDEEFDEDGEEMEFEDEPEEDEESDVGGDYDGEDEEPEREDE